MSFLYSFGYSRFLTCAHGTRTGTNGTGSCVVVYSAAYVTFGGRAENVRHAYKNINASTL